jgi:hypothetical protein
MPATIRIDFDVHSESISKSLEAELAKVQGIVSSANKAFEAAKVASINTVAKKEIDTAKQLYTEIASYDKERAKQKAEVDKQVAKETELAYKQLADEQKRQDKEASDLAKQQAKEEAEYKKQQDKAFADYEKQQAKEKLAAEKLSLKEKAELHKQQEREKLSFIKQQEKEKSDREKQQIRDAAEAEKQAKSNARAQEKAAEEAARAKKLQDDINNARSFDALRASAEKDIAQMRAGFSAQVWGGEKQAATAIVNEIGKLQQKKDELVRAFQIENLSAVEQAQLSQLKKKNDIELASMRRLALENKQIAEHGAGASVGIMGIGRNIEKNFDKAVGMSKILAGSLGVASGFTLSGLVNSANEAKDRTEAMATVLRSANVPAEQIATEVGKLKDNANAFADEMGLSRKRAQEVATEIVGITGLTGDAASQATNLALTYEEATGGIITAEKFSKLLTKSIGDPENEKALKSLEAKYPGIGAKIAAAATEQEKLNILQQAASPAMEQMAENASGLFDRIQVGFASATDSVGEFLGANMDTIGAVGQMSAGVIPLIGSFKQYAVASKAVTAAQWLWNAAMNANPIGLIITAVAALVGGLILLYNNVEPVRKAIDGMVSWVVTAYKSFMSWYDSLGIVGKALMFIVTPISGVIQGIIALTGWLSDLFGEEEKVVKSTNQLTTANIANTESSKQRAEAIAGVIAKLKEEKAANESTVEGAKALIVDALIKIENAKNKLNAETSASTRAYLKQYIKDTEEYIQTTLVSYGKGASLSLEMRKKFEDIADAMLGSPKTKDTPKVKEIKIPEFTLPTLELPIPDTEKFEENIEAKIYSINTIADAEEFALKLQHASNLIDEKTFNDKVYEIRLKALLEKKRLYELEPDMARKVQDEITQLERNRLIELAKASAEAAKIQADGAKKAIDSFKSLVGEIQNAVSGYTDLIFKVLGLNSAEKKRNEEWDNALDKELEKNDKLTNSKASLAKTEAERNKILSTGEKERERMFTANEKRQKESKAATDEYTAEQKVKSLINAGAAMVQAIANIIANSASLGPFGIIAAPATIAAAFGLFEAAKANLGFKDGGPVEGHGYPDGTDTVPARLDKGEFVLRKEAVQAIGKAKLYAMNAGEWIPKMSTGGMLEDLWDKSLRIGSFQNGVEGNKNTFTIDKNSIGEVLQSNSMVVNAIDRQTSTFTQAFAQQRTVLNSDRMLLGNKVAQRRLNRETV